MDLYHSIIGLPFSGKTTFLAALWHLIESAEIETGFVVDRLEGDHKYLNTIATSWRECRALPRTTQAGEVEIAIHAHFPKSDRRFTLRVPDLAGESFERQFAGRVVREDYAAGFNKPGGVVLFVSANKATDGLTLSDLGPELLSEDEHGHGSTGNGGKDGVQASERSVPWKHDMAPQQAVLVDLLQMLQGVPFEARLRKLAVVISAWDVVSAADKPAVWLQREMPLLHQFLVHNPQSFDFRVWGVSAQGGAIDGSKRQALLGMTPSERVRCLDSEADGHDLTVPIAWLSEAL